jgi:pimeloyl-ACP methyl ester carboxylesterase
MTSSPLRLPGLTIVHAVAAVALIIAALTGLLREREGLSITRQTVDGAPVTVFRGSDAPGPVVVIAHGFAGSQQLMQAFAISAARVGVIAVTFDFLGHGRHPRPLGGSVTEIGGATRALMGQTAEIVRFARGLGDGRVALLGHSMASDVLIRVAQADPDIAATVAVSAFSRVVTAQSPRNLLLIAGEWEGYLSAEALRIVGLSTNGAPAAEGVTYGEMAAGTARRFVRAPHAEHVGVLYSPVTLGEAQDWLARAFGLPDGGREPPARSRTGWFIVLLLAGLVLAALPLSRLLPVVSLPPRGGGAPWRRLWPVVLVPMIATPLILRVTPTHFLPILVADYLAVHFAAYGLLTALMLRIANPGPPGPAPAPRSLLLAATLGALAITCGGLFVAIDLFVTSVRPTPERAALIAALLAGTASYFAATEWAMRGPAAARGAAVLMPLAFLLSLAGAVALDPRRLFFLAIIVPVIVPFMAVFGLFGRWIHRRTGHPLPGALAQALAFALAIGATFPMLTG